MLRCSDASFYVGVTNNIVYRIGQHEFGHDPKAYTFSRRPFVLVHVSDFMDINQAIRWEKQLKGWTRAKKQALITNDWRRIQELAVAYYKRGNAASPFDAAQGDKKAAQGDKKAAQGDKKRGSG